MRPRDSSAADASAASDARNQVPEGPLVFQCNQCRSVIGDSFSFVAAIESLDAIVLSVVVQAAVAARQQSDGHGQTFHEVTCECGNTIGRRFSKHPQSRVHPILGYYTLDRTSIMSYELGSGITDASEVPNDFSAVIPRLPGEVGGVGAGAGEDVQAAVSDVQEDVAKVKAMTLLFDERLRAIEDLLRVEKQLKVGSAGSGKSSGQKRKR